MVSLVLFNPVSNRIDSFHNFRYIHSERERACFTSWGDPALAVVLAQDLNMIKDRRVLKYTAIIQSGSNDVPPTLVKRRT